MTDVSKHDTEKEWENGNCKQTGIDFLISWGSVSGHDFLEGSGKVIEIKMTGRFGFELVFSQADKGRQLGEKESDFISWDPNFGNHNVVSAFKKIHGTKDE